MKRKKRKQQKHGVPTIISFFIPGVGQMIKGEVGKGILILLGMFVSVLLIFVLIGFITTPILYIWQLIDAYNHNPE